MPPLDFESFSLISEIVTSLLLFFSYYFLQISPKNTIFYLFFEFFFYQRLKRAYNVKVYIRYFAVLGLMAHVVRKHRKIPNENLYASPADTLDIMCQTQYY